MCIRDSFGLDSQSAGNAQALLLAAGKAQSALFQAVLDLVPELSLIHIYGRELLV